MLTLDRRNSKQSISTVTLNLDSETGSRYFQLPVEDDEYPLNVPNMRPKKRYVGPWKHPGTLVDKDQTYFNMALSGTKYLDKGKRKGDEMTQSETTNQNKENKEIQNGGFGIDVPQFKHPLPPISVKDMENHSLLPYGFGFNQNRSDTFMGIQIRRNKLKSLDDQIASQARRHIFACSNVGSVRNACRANQSVVALKQTLEATKTNGHQNKQSSTPVRFSNTPASSCRALTRGEKTRPLNAERTGLAMPEINGYSILK
ncbi:hypothetical protein LOTGIDRAFT_231904 [Lottia gigantea]|uniref:Uncharacterized protein n=1 Tax=Lottia gigantea TaxID=225164 RepID=V4AFL8_LOTGI|nr:hypothetical protein LOTGIDRAFT_231904 [Lottia gigantea]ESO95677.1 hypothetical protein LOTGIDRAFT_231904 [Lottia gigantea]